MVDVVLIRPRYYIAASLYNKTRSNDVKEFYPPLGLCYLKAKLQQSGYSVEILDGLIFSRENIYDRIREVSPKIIGIYVGSSTISEVVALIKNLRLISKSPIVLGEPHITHCPESVQFFSADYGIRGDGEESFLKLTRFLIHREGSLHDISGIIPANDRMLQISDKADILDLDQLPFPDFGPASESFYSFPLNSANERCRML